MCVWTRTYTRKLSDALEETPKGAFAVVAIVQKGLRGGRVAEHCVKNSVGWRLAVRLAVQLAVRMPGNDGRESGLIHCVMQMMRRDLINAAPALRGLVGLLGMHLWCVAEVHVRDNVACG